jgi:hydrogenase maturation protease
MQTLVIGYGSLLRGDDAIGRHVAEALEAIQLPDSWSIYDVHQLTPELADPISRAEKVIFVDAIAGEKPGEVSVFPLVGKGSRGSGTVHQTTPEGLLDIAEKLFGRCPPAYVVTICGMTFDLSEELSPFVAAALPEAVARVLALAKAGT